MNAIERGRAFARTGKWSLAGFTNADLRKLLALAEAAAAKLAAREHYIETARQSMTDDPEKVDRAIAALNTAEAAYDDALAAVTEPTP